MADEEKRSDDDKPGDGEEARPEDARPEDARRAEGEASSRPEAGAEGSEGAEEKEEHQPDSINQTTGVKMFGRKSQDPSVIAGTGPEGTSEDVKAASPIEPTPGITQDSDSAAAAIKPATRLGEEHAGASQQGHHPHVAGHDEHGLSHTTTLQLLFGVFAALTILTILTVAVTGIDLGAQGNFVVAMVIATIKACLVMAFFMHMIWDSKFNVVVFVSSFLFVLLFLTMSLADRAEYQRAIDTWETANTAEEG